MNDSSSSNSNDGNDGGEDLGILPFDDGSTGRIIRRVWHDGRWYFSVIDVIAVLTDSPNPGNYWRVLKSRLTAEGADQTITHCNALKMRALDGKMRATDAADAETMLRIVQSVPSPKAEPVKQWLAHEGARRLDEVAAKLPENQQRLLLRRVMADRNNALADAATSHDILTSRDFGIFQDWGYRGLYAGETAKDIAVRMDLPKGEHILDHMGSTELGANIFRVTQTTDKLRQLADEGITGKEIANQTHYTVGKEVRAAIERIGGTMPEALPTPAQSIKELEQQEQERARARLQPPLL
ncbi:MAG TPA: BRO family protein [Ktedonobacterales bacterium]|jgi:DNA-damage-inducible protein D